MNDVISAVYRRINFLNEMGIGQQWLRRDRQAAALPETASVPAEPELAARPAAPGATGLGLDAATSAWAMPAEANTRRPATPARAAALAQPPDQPADQAVAERIADMSWMQLKAAVAKCTACGLCHARTQTVFGVGDEKARWLFVGEAPGRNEDVLGEPFVGQAGKLLDNMLLAMNLSRGHNTYIANIVKCRPADALGNDRSPTLEEASACRAFLDRQIALIQPAIIVALGKTAALNLLRLDPDTSVSALRGKVHAFAAPTLPTIPLIVTYHPAYLLRKPGEKANAWSDLCLAKTTYAKPD